MNKTTELLKEKMAKVSANSSIWSLKHGDDCIGNSFDFLKEDFECLYGAGKLPDSLLVEVETINSQIVDKLFVFPTGNKEADCVIVNNWEELSEYYSDEAISKFGFRVSWVKEIHSS